MWAPGKPDDFLISEAGFRRKINGEKFDVINIEITEPAQGSTYVFLGDGNSTFSAAFARKRRSWLGIIQTGYYPQCTFRPHLDATKLGDRVFLKSRLGIQDKDSAITLWFQCPWSHTGSQALFLREFFENAAGVQDEDDLLVLGIFVDKGLKTCGTPWIQSYGQLQSHGKPFYQCIGADSAFVGHMLRMGYRHLSHRGNPVGLTSNTQFATLLFKRSILTAS